MKAYALRLPEDLHARLVGMAAEAKRSLNSEIIYRLETSTQNGVTFTDGPALVAAAGAGGGAGGTDGSVPSPPRSNPPVSSSTKAGLARPGGSGVGRGRTKPRQTEPPGRPSPKPSHRSAMCEHRRPANTFCPVCDV